MVPQGIAPFTERPLQIQLVPFTGEHRLMTHAHESCHNLEPIQNIDRIFAFQTHDQLTNPFMSSRR